MKIALKTAIVLSTIATTALAQVITPVWVQRIVGSGPQNTTLLNVDPTNKLAILAGSRVEPNNNEDGTETQPVFVRLQRYDANRLLLFVSENGINETDPNLTADQRALAATYPDKSIIWLDAHTGATLGVAFHEVPHPAQLIGIDVQNPATGNQNPAYDPVFTFYWRPSLDDGPPGQKALYSGINHLILRYAPLADGSGWTNIPTVAYAENVPGIGDGLTDASGGSSGDNARRWRWRNFRVSGYGTNTVITGGGGTWRPGMHTQFLVTSDGLTFHPAGRVADRSGGIRNDYSGGGTGSRVAKYGLDPAHPNVQVYYQGHYPAYAYPSETPERYVSDPDQFWAGSASVQAYNQQPTVAMFESTPGLTNSVSGATNNLPPFTWQQAGKNGLTIDTSVDGIANYDGAWSIDCEANSSLDYIVSYSCPSWNNAVPVPTHGWIGIHRLDGSIAGGPGSSYGLPVTERDVPVSATVGNEALYNGWVEVTPDTTAAPNLKKAEILGAFGPVGFGLFTVENVAATITAAPPSTITILENQPLSINVGVTGSPNVYLWTKGGVPLDGTKTNIDGSFHYPATILQGVKTASLYIPLASVSDSGIYQLSITNPLSGAILSTTVNVTVQPDTNKPTIVSVTALGEENTYGSGPFLVKVLFNKKIDPTTGGTAANYSIAGATVLGVTLHSIPAAAFLGGDWREAIVWCSDLTPGTKYTLHVQGVKDQTTSANTIAPVDVPFVAPVQLNGKILWDYFGPTVDNLYPTAPLTEMALSAFDSKLITKGDLNNVPGYGSLGDNYQDMLSGWIIPKVTTNYVFFLDADDAAQLYLSTDASAGNVQFACGVTTCCQGFLETNSLSGSNPDSVSSPRLLVAGNRYYIQATHTEGGGGDYVRAAWRIDGDPTPASSLQPISSAYLASYQPVQFLPPVYSGGQITLSWTGTGTLLQSTDLVTWTPVAGNPPSPFTFTPGSGPKVFYRVQY